LGIDGQPLLREICNERARVEDLKKRDESKIIAQDFRCRRAHRLDPLKIGNGDPKECFLWRVDIDDYRASRERLLRRAPTRLPEDRPSEERKKCKKDHEDR